MQFNLSQLEIPAGNQLLLKNIGWETFERLLEELGDNRGTCLSFSENTVEIMAPTAAHENDIVKFLENNEHRSGKPSGFA